MAPSSKKATQQSPAEFFADNQNIAGFDNPGKALYTTVRELVENSLDAAESIRVLPDVQVELEELSHEAFADIRGLGGVGERTDMGLYKEKAAKGKKSKKKQDDDPGKLEQLAAEANKGGKDEHYFRLTCVDNGCGMVHKEVPNMFGRVLSGSNYAVRQARGKFGLGAKMALIWSKKSTGLPIEVTTGHSTDSSSAPSFVTYCKVDIDINKNEPQVYVHKKLDNGEGWRGAKVSLVMSGNWTSYKRRILDYLQQLAVITPYANISFTFKSQVSPKKNFSIEYARRSEQLCDVAKEVKYHPKSVDNVIVSQLLSRVPRPGSTSLAKFLATEFSCIDNTLAGRLVDELAAKTKKQLDKNSTCEDLSPKQIHQIAELLRQTTVFPDPKADCLSPAGEYNLRLGVMKEFEPELVATACSKPVVYNGHPALVEAAVALGSNKQSNPGINVFRFANRIPLLFEPGSDVVTIVSKEHIKWGQYFINPKNDKISVFVSIASTKIPFKGTGKEFIGAEVEPIKKAVQECLKSCAISLKAKVSKKRQERDRANRMNNLVRYIPDVSRALLGVVEQMKEQAESARKRARLEEEEEQKQGQGMGDLAEKERIISEKLMSTLETELLNGAKLTTDVLASRLEQGVNQADMDSAMELEKKRGRGVAQRVPFFLVPRAPDQLLMAHPIMDHPVLAMRFFAKAQQ